VSRAGTWYGAIWSIVLALDFFLISSPLVFEPVFDESLRRAVICTTVACVVSVPRLRVPRIPWSLALFLAYGLATALWSINQAFTVHFLSLYVVLAVLGVVVASNIDTRVLSQGLVLGAVVVVLTSVYAYWRGLPGADVAPGSSGFIAGVGTNRNILAYTMIIAFAFAVSFVPRRWPFRIGWLLAVALIVAGIILAESATGVAALAILLATALVLGSRDRLVALGRPPGRRYWATLTGVLLTLGAVSVGWYEALHRSLQRDLSLTGRVQIWESVWATCPTKVKLIGDGWGNVWPHPWRLAPPNGAFDRIVGHIGHVVFHGHNSLFDLLPEVGLLGVALYTLVYLQSLARAFRQRRTSTSPGVREAGRATTLGVVGLLLAGVTEPISVIPLGFFVAVLIVANVHQEKAEPRHGDVPQVS
jgi:O-antigen ligase